VQFSVDGSASGIVPAAVSGGSASSAYTFSSAGSHAVTAVFTSTDSNYANSSDAVGASVSVTVATTTALSVSPSSGLRMGDTITLNATVTASDGHPENFPGGVNVYAADTAADLDNLDYLDTANLTNTRRMSPQT
jgi:hypothetical protein